MNQIKTWLAPLGATIVLAVFVIGSAIFYTQVQDELREKECAIVAKAIAFNLVNEIKNVARLLNGLSQIENANTTNKIQLYEKISQNLFENYPGFFYGINFINSKGVIERIFPYKGNESALGRNLMERPELKPYLLQSLEKKTATMSHRVITYQGIYAIIIYEPLYDSQNQFKGWVNAVINIDTWLKNQLESEDWGDIFIHMHWQGEKAYDLIFGKERPKKVFSYSLNILNQNITIGVGQVATSLNSLHNRLWYGLEIVGVCLLMLISFLLFRLTISRKELLKANQQLNLKSLLLNALAHDVSSPLTSLGLFVEQMAMKKETSLTPSAKERALKSLNILTNMLTSVRTLSRLQMHKEDLIKEPVPIKQALVEAVERVEPSALNKKISIKIDLHDSKAFVWAHESTLKNNVLPNVLNNAIKFSPVGSVIVISSESSTDSVWILVSDEGGGFTLEELTQFSEGTNLHSNLGTTGELGSGLGLAQVKGFMELYDGEIRLANSDKGALIKLRFKKAPLENHADL